MGDDAMFGVPRREFVRRLLALAGAGAAASALPALAAVPERGPPLEFVIVGAGLAGLVAAYELEQRGHRVTLLEADARHIGGRTRTLRFADGRHGEAGAMRIPKGHALTRRYIAQFGLPLRPFVSSNDQAYFHVRGERCRIADVKKLYPRFALTASEHATASPDEFWTAAVGSVAQRLSEAERQELRADTLTSASVRALDQQSLQQLCEAAGLSQEAIELLAVTSGQETLLPTAAPETLREELDATWTQGFDEITGGTDTLAAAFAARLRSKPRLGCVVTGLMQDPARLRAAALYREGGVQKRAEGDFLLCTLPLPVLSRIVVAPEFSGPKLRAIREINYDSSTKVLAVARRRFWEADDGIYGGGTFTDLPIGTAYYPTATAGARDPRVSAGPGVLLASYSWGQTARRLAGLPHDERSALALAHLGARPSAAADAGHDPRDAQLELGQPSVQQRRVRVVQPGTAHRPVSRRGRA